MDEEILMCCSFTEFYCPHENATTQDTQVSAQVFSKNLTVCRSATTSFGAMPVTHVAFNPKLRSAAYLHCKEVIVPLRGSNVALSPFFTFGIFAATRDNREVTSAFTSNWR